MTNQATKIKKQGPPGPPPRPGLQWNPQSHRWVSRRTAGAAAEEQRMSDRAKPPADLHTVNPAKVPHDKLRFYQAHAQNVERSAGDVVAKYGADESMPKEVRQQLINHLKQAGTTRSGFDQELERRGTASKSKGSHSVVKSLVKFTRRHEGQDVLTGLANILKGNADAVPIEQLKGDIARKGHIIKRLIALDVESRRLFFSDPTNNFLYAEYAGAEEGFGIVKIGFQKEIAKEYDVTDFEHSGEPDTVVTENEEISVEDMGYDKPGMIPGGTPASQPVTGADQREGKHKTEEYDVNEQQVVDKARRLIKNVGSLLSPEAR